MVVRHFDVVKVVVVVVAAAVVVVGSVVACGEDRLHHASEACHWKKTRPETAEKDDEGHGGLELELEEEQLMTEGGAPDSSSKLQHD